MPRSSARCTTLRVAARSSLPPKLLQPSPTSETCRPDLPRFRICMRDLCSPPIAPIVGLEGIGIPIPGETTLILAAVYAGSTHHLDIRLVIVAAAAGSIVGSIIGFWIGREIGYPLLLRYGHYVGLTESKIKIGQYLFRSHGGKIVFFGRFVPLLRTIAALLAGANCMSWSRFLLFNTAGSILWAGAY